MLSVSATSTAALVSRPFAGSAKPRALRAVPFVNVRDRTNRAKLSGSVKSRSSTGISGRASRLGVVASSEELAVLKAVKVISVTDGRSVDLPSVISDNKRVLVPFFTQFGDFDSWELAQKLVDYLPELSKGGVDVVAVGIGSLEAAELFCEKTNWPKDRLFADPDGYAYAALGFEPGCGRPGGALPWLSNIAAYNGYAALLLMCAGVGSPGTLAEVFRGYLGDRNAAPVFNTGSNVDLSWKGAFDLVGKGFQRPFELATLRLNNMAAILNNWKVLTPEDSNLLVQRGGALLLDGGKVVFRHDDAGILGYCKPERLVKRALQADPSVVQEPTAVLHAAAQRKAAVEDVYEAIRLFEARKPLRPAFDGASVNGQWRLHFTTGTAEKSANANRRKGGSYFPVAAVQSFNASTGHIRNGIYAGPLAFFFDGPFVWDDQRKILEFTFDRVSLRWGEGKPLRFNIGSGAWEKLKGAEEAASDGQGKMGKAAAGGRKLNPFFKFVFADAKCIAARGRGGGLALWGRESDEPVEVDEEYYATRPRPAAAAAGKGFPVAR